MVSLNSALYGKDHRSIHAKLVNKEGFMVTSIPGNLYVHETSSMIFFMFIGHRFAKLLVQKSVFPSLIVTGHFFPTKIGDNQK